MRHFSSTIVVLALATLVSITLAGISPRVAFAGQSIVDPPHADSSRTAPADTLPSPDRAIAISSFTTLRAEGIGLAFLTVGALASTYRGTTSTSSTGPVLASVGMIAMAGGLIVGPAEGYVYGRCGRRGAAGALLRLAILGGGIGLGAAAGSSADDVALGAAVGGVLGTAVTIPFAIYDCAAVGGTVRRANAARASGVSSLRLAPALMPGGTPGVAVTLALPSGGR